MPDLPPDLARLGDALEQAVGRAVKRRRDALRAAGALTAVVAAVPMALAAAHLHLASGDGRVPAGLSAAPTARPTTAGVVLPEAARSRASGSDRVRPGVAAGRARNRRTVGGPPHPLDTMPPPVTARAARGYEPGVATERVDRRPAFMATLF